MYIYTYYEDIDFNQQDELIDIWSTSWSANGFTPVVLTRSDAEKHPYYHQFVKSLQEINQKIIGDSLTPYCLSCFLRWLAYSTIDNNNQVIMTSDYDVINMGVGVEKLTDRHADDKINFYSWRCPCLVSGKPVQFEEFCHIFVNLPLEDIKNSKEIFKNLNATRYHDNVFTKMYGNKLKSKIRFSVDEVHTVFKGMGNYNNRLVHFSHDSISKFKGNKLTFDVDLSNDALRIEAIKACCIQEGITYEQ